MLSIDKINLVSDFSKKIVISNISLDYGDSFYVKIDLTRPRNLLMMRCDKPFCPDFFKMLVENTILSYASYSEDNYIVDEQIVLDMIICDSQMLEVVPDNILECIEDIAYTNHVMIKAIIRDLVVLLRDIKHNDLENDTLPMRWDELGGNVYLTMLSKPNLNLDDIY